MSDKFKPGATVRLKSGGPLMTVHGYSGIAPGVPTSTVICKWFDGNKPMTENFHEDSLDAESPD